MVVLNVLGIVIVSEIAVSRSFYARYEAYGDLNSSARYRRSYMDHRVSLISQDIPVFY